MNPSEPESHPLNGPDELESGDGDLVARTQDEWKPVETAYLKQLKASHRARARGAMRWRPRFLKALAMSCNITSALKAARVSYNTVRAHERNDPEFATQVKEAQEEGAQLLHDVSFRDALEGVCEPVYWQGQIVGHIRKYDNRLRIEMLRAHMPDLFRTPGAKVPVNAQSNVSNNFAIIDDAARHRLVELRQEALRAIAAGRDARAHASSF